MFYVEPLPRYTAKFILFKKQKSALCYDLLKTKQNRKENRRGGHIFLSIERAS